MFIFDALGYEKGDALEIIRSYIGRHKFKEGKIDGGNNSKVNEYDLKLEKLKIEENRFTSVKSFENSVFILNKIDTVNTEEEQKETNQHFINYIESKTIEIVEDSGPKIKINENKNVNNIVVDNQKEEVVPNKEANNYKNDNEHNINLKLKERENELPISGEKLDKENSKFDSFEKYIDYNLNYSGDISENSFYEYLINEMNKEFEFEPKLKAKKNDVTTKKIPKDMKEEDKNKFKEFEEYFTSRNNLDFISPKNYMKLKIKFNEIKSKHKKKKENIFISILKNKMRDTIEKYLNMDNYYFLYDEQSNDLFCQKLKINKQDNKNKKLERGIQKAFEKFKDFGKIKELETFEEKINKIYEIDPTNEKMANIVKKMVVIKIII